MGFFESKMFQDALALFIIVYFLISFYSMFRKQTVKDTWDQIKGWYDSLDVEEEIEDG